MGIDPQPGGDAVRDSKDGRGPPQQRLPQARDRLAARPSTCPRASRLRAGPQRISKAAEHAEHRSVAVLADRDGGFRGRHPFRGCSQLGPGPATLPVPTGVAVFPGDTIIRPLAERDHNVVRWSEFSRGGHFAAMEAPHPAGRRRAGPFPSLPPKSDGPIVGRNGPKPALRWAPWTSRSSEPHPASAFGPMTGPVSHSTSTGRRQPFAPLALMERLGAIDLGDVAPPAYRDFDRPPDGRGTKQRSRRTVARSAKHSRTGSTGSASSWSSVATAASPSAACLGLVASGSGSVLPTSMRTPISRPPRNRRPDPSRAWVLRWRSAAVTHGWRSWMGPPRSCAPRTSPSWGGGTPTSQATGTRRSHDPASLISRTQPCCEDSIAGTTEAVLARVGRDDLSGFLTLVDCDVINPHMVPAVGSPEPGGPTIDELAAFLIRLVEHPKAIGLALTLYTPRATPTSRPGGTSSRSSRRCSNEPASSTSSAHRAAPAPTRPARNRPHKRFERQAWSLPFRAGGSRSRTEATCPD